MGHGAPGQLPLPVRDRALALVGDFAGGQEHFTSVAGLGPEWKFIGAGNYLGQGTNDFMIENTSGALYLGVVSGGVD